MTSEKLLKSQSKLYIDSGGYDTDLTELSKVVFMCLYLDFHRPHGTRPTTIFQYEQRLPMARFIQIAG